VRGQPVIDSAVEGAVLRLRPMSIFLLPALYVWMAGEHDVLPEPEAEFD
jgi:hypothetical protein